MIAEYGGRVLRISLLKKYTFAVEQGYSISSRVSLDDALHELFEGFKELPF